MDYDIIFPDIFMLLFWTSALVGHALYLRSQTRKGIYVVPRNRELNRWTTRKLTFPEAADQWEKFGSFLGRNPHDAQTRATKAYLAAGIILASINLFSLLTMTTHTHTCQINSIHPATFSDSQKVTWTIGTSCGTVSFNDGSPTPPPLLVGNTYQLTYVKGFSLFTGFTTDLINYPGYNNQ